jgi:hypothetical protein
MKKKKNNIRNNIYIYNNWKNLEWEIRKWNQNFKDFKNTFFPLLILDLILWKKTFFFMTSFFFKLKKTYVVPFSFLLLLFLLNLLSKKIIKLFFFICFLLFHFCLHFFQKNKRNHVLSLFHAFASFLLDYQKLFKKNLCCFF